MSGNWLSEDCITENWSALLPPSEASGERFAARPEAADDHPPTANSQDDTFMAGVSGTPEESGDAPALRADTLADSVLVLLALTGLQRLIGLVRSVLFCRWLDPQQLGLWDMAFGFLLFVAPIAVLSLPGTFGRYVEHYRRRGQLRVLLRRTSAFCALSTSTAVLVIGLFSGQVSYLIFGAEEHGRLIVLSAASLVAVISFNYLTELAVALRKVRLVSLIQLLNSMAFAGMGICLVLSWRASAESVVLAYGSACLISSVCLGVWLRRVWLSLPEAQTPLPHRALWGKLVPFVAWLWTINLLSHLSELADRYMVIHYSQAADPQALVGQYHSARIIPVLLVSVAAMLGTVVTPHLSADWEAGRRERVSLRLNLFLKLLAFALALAGAMVLAVAPLLFGVVLQNRFAEGQSVLPLTLASLAWLALTTVALNYLWCLEKARLGSLSLLAGLVVNVFLNLLLLPRMGLRGAVLASGIAHLLVLISVCAFSSMWGFRVDRGTWLMFALPPVVCLGPWLALLVLGAVAADAIVSDRLLSSEEKRLLARKWQEYLERLQAWREWSICTGHRDSG